MHLTFIVTFTVLILVNFPNVNCLLKLDDAEKERLKDDFVKAINEELKKLSPGDQSISSERRKKRGFGESILGLASMYGK
uniref:Uncharacterized protein n=1 Tax=Schistosoma mansoni TaxID=6183 RepID=A0A5K4F5A5_SCHMA